MKRVTIRLKSSQLKKIDGISRKWAKTLREARRGRGRVIRFLIDRC